MLEGGVGTVWLNEWNQIVVWNCKWMGRGLQPADSCSFTQTPSVIEENGYCLRFYSITVIDTGLASRHDALNLHHLEHSLPLSSGNMEVGLLGHWFLLLRMNLICYSVEVLFRMVGLFWGLGKWLERARLALTVRSEVPVPVLHSLPHCL